VLGCEAIRLLAAGLCAWSMLIPTRAYSQLSAPAADARVPTESELFFFGFTSIGHNKVFADTYWSELHVGGMEYDRNSWGKFLTARMDYVAAIEPILLLHEPADTDVWGDPLSKAQKYVPGLGIEPIGLRWTWFDKRWAKPYFLARGGLFTFTEKAISPKASYLNFSLHFGTGVQVRLTERFELRMEGAYQHFSNGFAVPYNPGLDVMTINAGISYHLGKRLR